MLEVSVKVYAFEGPYGVYALGSLTYAEAYFEAIDVENDEYVFFGDDGTVITSSVRDERVVLTVTSEKRPDDLRERLRTFLAAQSAVARDPALADNPAAVADLLIEHNRARRWLRWPAWLRLCQPR